MNSQCPSSVAQVPHVDAECAVPALWKRSQGTCLREEHTVGGSEVLELTAMCSSLWSAGSRAVSRFRRHGHSCEVMLPCRY